MDAIRLFFFFFLQDATRYSAGVRCRRDCSLMRSLACRFGRQQYHTRVPSTLPTALGVGVDADGLDGQMAPLLGLPYMGWAGLSEPHGTLGARQNRISSSASVRFHAFHSMHSMHRIATQRI